MAAAVTPFYILDTTFAGFEIDTSAYNYLGFRMDAMDGFLTPQEQVSAFVELYVTRAGALIDIVADTGTLTFGGASLGMPANNPDRLSATYVFDQVSLADPSTWRFIVRFGNINNYKKEYFLKRVWRLLALQRRDRDNEQHLARSFAGRRFYQEAMFNDVATVSDSVNGMIGGRTANILNFTAGVSDVVYTADSSTDPYYKFTLINPSITQPLTHPTPLSAAVMQSIFNQYIIYKTGGAINPSSLVWVTYTTNVSNLDVTLRPGSGSANSIIADQINDLVVQGVYSPYDRLRYEMASNTTTNDINISTVDITP